MQLKNSSLTCCHRKGFYFCQQFGFHANFISPAGSQTLGAHFIVVRCDEFVHVFVFVVTIAFFVLHCCNNSLLTRLVLSWLCIFCTSIQRHAALSAWICCCSRWRDLSRLKEVLCHEFCNAWIILLFRFWVKLFNCIPIFFSPQIFLNWFFSGTKDCWWMHFFSNYMRFYSEDK